jgi:hypothetical protein
LVTYLHLFTGSTFCGPWPDIGSKTGKAASLLLVTAFLLLFSWVYLLLDS